MTRKKTPFDFETALAELEGLVDAMEDGNMSLEDSLKAFEKGVRLTRDCQQALAHAEQKVQLLMKDGDLPESVAFAMEGTDEVSDPADDDSDPD